MKKNSIYLIICFLVFSKIFTCTIGVCSGDVTTDGKPLIWKNRDVSSATVVHYFTEDSLEYHYMGVGNENSNYIWMGINNVGFAILNALASFNRLPGNGDIMKIALGSCSTVEEFNELLNETNITGRETHTNYAVIDSNGSAIMYEVSANEWWSFDTTENNSGFVVRANTAYHGGAGDAANHQRSAEILSQLISENNLNANTILKNFNRDFSPTYPKPFPGRYMPDKPWGYLKLNDICKPMSNSAVVIQGRSPEEPVCFSTMWTMLALPTTTIASPIFPIDSIPVEMNHENHSDLHYASTNINSILRNFSDNSYIDTYNLFNDENTGFLQQTFLREEVLFNMVEERKSEWINLDDPIPYLLTLQNDICAENLAFLQNISLDENPVFDFTSQERIGIDTLQVHFFESSLHAPLVTGWEWDFNSDGIIDSEERDPIYTYSQIGTYDVTLTLHLEEEAITITKENYITISDNYEHILISDPPCIEVFEVDQIQQTIYLENISAYDLIVTELSFYLNYFNFEIAYINEPFPVTIAPDSTLQILYELCLPTYLPEREIIDDTLIVHNSYGEFKIPIQLESGLISDLEEGMVPCPVYDISLYPNPVNLSNFRNVLIIDFTLKETSNTSISFYNIKGQKIDSIFEGVCSKGKNSFTWNINKNISDGVFFIELKTNKSKSYRKVVLIK